MTALRHFGPVLAEVMERDEKFVDEERWGRCRSCKIKKKKKPVLKQLY